MSVEAQGQLMPDAEGLAKALREPLLKVFPPALLGRLVTIPYYPLSDEGIDELLRDVQVQASFGGSCLVL